jgi:sirohydrochlorin ferrochelatase
MERESSPRIPRSGTNPEHDPGAVPAVILVGHGDRGAGLTNRNLLAHTEALRRSGRLNFVAAGVLKGEPLLEQVIESACNSGAEQICIYPFFMADGYFAGKILPERIAAAAPKLPWTILPPLGLDARLPKLIVDQSLAAARQATMTPAQTRLLLVGHGSKLGPASANATRKAAEAIREIGGFGTVATAFLEEAPFLADALAAYTTEPTIVTGFFSGDGMHAGEDVPRAIEDASANAVYAGPIGAAPAIADVMLETIVSHAPSRTGSAP